MNTRLLLVRLLTISITTMLNKTKKKNQQNRKLYDKKVQKNSTIFIYFCTFTNNNFYLFNQQKPNKIMATLGTTYLKLKTAKEIVANLEKEKANGIALTFAISDEENQFNQNVSMYVEQSKEQREAKEKRQYVMNGKVFWTDGKVTAIKNQKQINEEKGDNLPF